MARVLVVDDSPSVRALVSDRIRKAGHVVEEASNGEAGAELALAECPDMVVTDLVMSGSLGRPALSPPAERAVDLPRARHPAHGSGDKRSRFWARSAGCRGVREQGQAGRARAPLADARIDAAAARASGPEGTPLAAAVSPSPGDKACPSPGSSTSACPPSSTWRSSTRWWRERSGPSEARGRCPASSRASQG